MKNIGQGATGRHYNGLLPGTVAPQRRVVRGELGGALSYRQARMVEEKICRWGHEVYPVCPRCRNTMEREYMGFCDRCGQRLAWDGYAHAAIRSY